VIAAHFEPPSRDKAGDGLIDALADDVARAKPSGRQAAAGIAAGSSLKASATTCTTALASSSGRRLGFNSTKPVPGMSRLLGATEVVGLSSLL
jgi:hypothetical protein